jgi:hypothetical protein
MTSRGSRQGRGTYEFNKKIAERMKPVDPDELYTLRIEQIIFDAGGQDALEQHRVFAAAHAERTDSG